MSWFDEAKRIAANTVLVMENTDQQTAQMRWDICLTCDKMNHEKNQCSICGCLLQAKIWAKYSRSKNRPFGELTHCPLGKWNDVNITNHYRQLDGLPPLSTQAPDNEPEDHFTF